MVLTSYSDSGDHHRATAELVDQRGVELSSSDGSSGDSSRHMSVVDFNSFGQNSSSDAASHSNENDSNETSSTHSGSNDSHSAGSPHSSGDASEQACHGTGSNSSSGGGLGKRTRTPSAKRAESEARAQQLSGAGEAEDGEVKADVHSNLEALMAAAEASARADAHEAGLQSTGSQRGAVGGSDRGLASAQRERPAPFLSKLMQIMENDAHAGGILHWDSEHVVGSNAPAPAFIIADTASFAKKILPLYFKHNKLSSFIQQLYTYGFRRVPCAEQSASGRPPTELPSHAISFQHPFFRADAPELMLRIKRNTASSAASSAAGSAVSSALSSSTAPNQVYDGAGDALMRGHAGSDSGEGWDRVPPSPMETAASGHYLVSSQGSFDAYSLGAGAGGMAMGDYGAPDEFAAMLGEVENLELSIEALERMQSERHTNDARLLTQMMRAVQRNLR